MRTINFSTETVKSEHCSLFPIPCSLPSPVDFRLGARSQLNKSVSYCCRRSLSRKPYSPFTPKTVSTKFPILNYPSSENSASIIGVDSVSLIDGDSISSAIGSGSGGCSCGVRSLQKASRVLAIKILE